MSSIEVGEVDDDTYYLDIDVGREEDSSTFSTNVSKKQLRQLHDEIAALTEV